MDTSIVTVNWNGARHVQNMLSSLITQTKGLNYEIIIVDNGSEPEEQRILETLKAQFKDTPIKLIYTGANLGFGKGCNTGAKLAKGRILAFINPDIVLTENTLHILTDELEKNPKIGLIAPKLLTSNKKTTFSAMKKSSILSIALGQLTLPIARAFHFKTAGNFYVNQDIPTFCDWVYGSFLMLPRKLFELIKGFDEQYFMYAEEADLCLSVKKEGNLVCYFPLTAVVHEGEAMAKKVPDLTIKRKAESEFKFFSKWNGRFYARVNAIINGCLFTLKGVIYSILRKEDAKKLIKMGKYRLSL